MREGRYKRETKVGLEVKLRDIRKLGMLEKFELCKGLPNTNGVKKGISRWGMLGRQESENAGSCPTFCWYGT